MIFPTDYRPFVDPVELFSGAGWGLLLPPLVFAVALGVAARSARADACGRLRSGAIEVVEGEVADLRPGPGRKTETFRVGSREIEYSKHRLCCGPRSYSKDGGPIQAGQYVRISIVGDQMLRVEVAAGGPHER